MKHYSLFGIRSSFFIALALLLASCGAENEYTSHQCYFIFNTTYHPSTMLIASVTSPSGFCLVYKGNKMVSGKAENAVYVEKYGETDPQSPYTYNTGVEPTVASLVIGYDNGLLLGYSAIDQILLAYDRCCPKCESLGGKLQWNNSNSSVKCSRCGTIYDLNVTGNGLSRYQASYDGQYIRVVNN